MSTAPASFIKAPPPQPPCPGKLAFSSSKRMVKPIKIDPSHTAKGANDEPMHVVMNICDAVIVLIVLGMESTSLARGPMEPG